MKKYIFILLGLLVMCLPINVLAEVQTLNLDEALTQEKIDHDFSNYKETDDQVVIYLFRGNGCKFCRAFLTFLNSIVEEYGQYFKVVSYEVWNNRDNSALLDEVATFLGYDPNDEHFGIPFIVIGDKVFDGYISSDDEDIINTIVSEYAKAVDDRYDVFEEMGKAPEEKKSTSSNTGLIIGCVFAFLVISTVTLIVINYNYFKKINERLNSIEKLVRLKGSK